MNECEDKILPQRCFYLFKELGMKPSLKGYDYTLEAVVLRKEANFEMQKIYTALAEKCNVHWTAIERAIRFVKENLCKKKNAKFREVFGDADKMTNSEFIAHLYNYLKYS